ncbi:hypothetical protein [Proteus phage 2]|nr:hypothetical protein [Proteus phage 1]QNN97888.1 hypothetical protein [Proteus phage 2]QOC54996.1 hypothetical protein [Proteus phage M4H10_20]
MPDYLGAKQSINKMSKAALELAECMYPLLEEAHNRKPNAGFDAQLLKLKELASQLKFYEEVDKEVSMYTLEYGGEVLYIAIRGDDMVVHSSMLKHLWEDRESFEFDKYYSCKVNEYFLDPSVLDNKVRIW